MNMILVDRIGIALIALAFLGIGALWYDGAARLAPAMKNSSISEQAAHSRGLMADEEVGLSPKTNMADIDAAFSGSGTQDQKSTVSHLILVLIGYFVLPVWLILRIFDFVFTGRIRSGRAWNS